MHVHRVGAISLQTDVWPSKSAACVHTYLSVFVMDRTQCLATSFKLGRIEELTYDIPASVY